MFENIHPHPEGRLTRAQVIQVIMTENTVGKGTPEDPCYIERLYWSMDGRLLAVGTLGD